MKLNMPSKEQKSYSKLLSAITLSNKDEKYMNSNKENKLRKVNLTTH